MAISTDLLQALKGEPLSSVFSTDGTLISASTALPTVGSWVFMEARQWVVGTAWVANNTVLLLVSSVRQANFWRHAHWLAPVSPSYQTVLKIRQSARLIKLCKKTSTTHGTPATPKPARTWSCPKILIMLLSYQTIYELNIQSTAQPSQDGSVINNQNTFKTPLTSQANLKSDQ